MRRHLVGSMFLAMAASACEPPADPVGAAAPTGLPTPYLAHAAVEPPEPAGTIVYDAIPSPFPGSWASVGFHASRTDEWGDLVQLVQAGTLGRVTVGLASWACENDAARARTEACVTTPGATFSHPVTINLYEVDRTGAEPAVGPRIATKTATFEIPFRPSWDESCGSAISNTPWGGKWFDPVLGTCVNGLATTVTFDFTGAGVSLPDELIYGVAFDTEAAGASPRGVPGPYDVLNVGVANIGTAPPPSVGADAEPDFTFVDSDMAGWYCDRGAGGVDVFRRDGCWNGITPIVQIELAPSPSEGGPRDGGSVTAGGWWDDGSGVRTRPHVSATVRAHPRTGASKGQVQLVLPAADLRVHASEIVELTVAGSEATVVARGRSPAGAVEVTLVLGDGSGPGGEDTVSVVVTLVDGGSVLHDSGGPHPLGGGSVQIEG